MNCPKCGIEIKDHPANACLDAVFCTEVMKWTKEEITYHTDCGSQKGTSWCDSAGNTKYIFGDFKPSTNISHAMEGVEKWKRQGEGHDFAEILMEIMWPPLKWSVKNRHPLAVITDLLLKLDALYLTRALILWAMGEGK